MPQSFRSRRGSGLVADIARVARMTHLGRGLCIAVVRSMRFALRPKLWLQPIRPRPRAARPKKISQALGDLPGIVDHAPGGIYFMLPNAYIPPRSGYALLKRHPLAPARIVHRYPAALGPALCALSAAHYAVQRAVACAPCAALDAAAAKFVKRHGTPQVGLSVGRGALSSWATPPLGSPRRCSSCGGRSLAPSCGPDRCRRSPPTRAGNRGTSCPTAPR